MRKQCALLTQVLPGLLAEILEQALRDGVGVVVAVHRAQAPPCPHGEHSVTGFEDRDLEVPRAAHDGGEVPRGPGRELVAHQRGALAEHLAQRERGHARGVRQHGPRGVVEGRGHRQHGEVRRLRIAQPAGHHLLQHVGGDPPRVDVARAAEEPFPTVDAALGGLRACLPSAFGLCDGGRKRRVDSEHGSHRAARRHRGAKPRRAEINAEDRCIHCEIQRGQCRDAVRNNGTAHAPVL